MLILTTALVKAGKNTQKCTTLTIRVLEVLHKPISCLVTEFESWKICIFLVRNARHLAPLRSFSSPVLAAQEEGSALHAR